MWVEFDTNFIIRYVHEILIMEKNSKTVTGTTAGTISLNKFNELKLFETNSHKNEEIENEELTWTE